MKKKEFLSIVQNEDMKRNTVTRVKINKNITNYILDSRVNKNTLNKNRKQSSPQGRRKQNNYGNRKRESLT